MKLIQVLFFLFQFFASANAQLNHFIYIESENKQPFYVQINEKLFSASSSGYAILPKLKEGVYKLNIGFPKNAWPSQIFDVTIGNKNAGFILKNFDTKGWALVYMQTMDIVTSSGTNSLKPTVAENKTETKSDAFSSLLADAVNPPAAGREMSEPPVVKISTDTQQTKPVVKIETGTESPVLKPLNKILSILDNTGRSMVYIDVDGNKMDTIRLFIPYNSAGIADTPAANPPPVIKKDENVQKRDLSDSQDAAGKIDTVTDKTLLVKDEKAEISIDKAGEKNIPVGGKNTYTVTSIDPACKSYATDEDFLKLRKKMASADSNEDMITAAKKLFKTKCFNTEQVKNLSMLFLDDKGKYDFYDASYHHVSDMQNFTRLQSQLSDEYYINRFKAMIR